MHGGHGGQLHLAVAAGPTAQARGSRNGRDGGAEERGTLLQAVAVITDFGYDDVHLVARVDFFAGALPQAGGPGGLLGEGHHVGRNLLAAGGQGVQHGHIQVAEHRHGDGARNGRRGHDQPVRQGAVGAAQAVTLLHAEAVLLVHHDQAQVVEAYVVGEQGVRTNHNLRGAVGELLQHLALGAGAHGGGQQAHAHAAGFLSAPRGASLG